MPFPRLFYWDDPNDEQLKKDAWLNMSIKQGYVPETCLLGGFVVINEVREGRDPCAGCDGPRERCKGRPKTSDEGLKVFKARL